MANKIVMGLIPTSSIEIALDNLQEADFDSKDISLIMQDEKQARQIADDTGPLKGVTMETLSDKLNKWGLSEDSIKEYMDGITTNNALIAITTGEESVSAAKSMLADYTKQPTVTV